MKTNEFKVKIDDKTISDFETSTFTFGKIVETNIGDISLAYKSDPVLDLRKDFYFVKGEELADLERACNQYLSLSAGEDRDRDATHDLLAINENRIYLEAKKRK